MSRAWSATHMRKLNARKSLALEVTTVRVLSEQRLAAAAGASVQLQSNPCESNKGGDCNPWTFDKFKQIFDPFEQIGKIGQIGPIGPKGP